MNYILILGIIVIGFGTYLTYLGTKKDNDKGQQQVNDKLDSFHKKLDIITHSNLNSQDKQKQIDSIKSEFDTWAKHLNENYLELELSHEKQIINESERNVKFNKTWIPIFSKAFDDLFQMVESINKEIPSQKITTYTNSKTFPKDIFSDENTAYYKIFEFNQNSFLRVNFTTVEETDYIPIMRFFLYNDLESAQRGVQLHNDGIVVYFKNNKSFYEATTGKFKSFKYVSKTQGDQYPINELTNFFQQVIQYQFIDSSKGKNKTT